MSAPGTCSRRQGRNDYTSLSELFQREMDLIGTSGNFADRAHRGVEHHGVAGRDTEFAKVSRQL